jgi:hypothetical protein
MAFCGVRGAGKSLCMAYYIAHALISGKRVLSNMNVSFKCIYLDGTIKVLSTEPLDMNALYALEEGIKDLVVAIDEIQYFSDSRKWQSMRNRLLNAIFMQLRKRGLDVLCTVKTPNWLDSRLRDMELDIIVQCCDWHFKNQDYPKGKYINLKWYDWSGSWTGQPWYASHKGKGNYDGMGMGIDPDLEMDLKFMERIWPIYHTEQVIDYIETLTDVKIGTKAQPMEKPEGVLPQDAQGKMLLTFVESMRNAGKTVVGCKEFWALAKNAGITKTSKVLGKDLKMFGVKRKPGYKGNDHYLLNYDQDSASEQG